MPSNIDTCIFQLQSDKIKERTQGLVDFTELFSQESFIKNHVKDWARGLLSVFTIINIEKENNNKKPTPASVSRISIAANAISHSVELGAKYIPRKDARQVFQHLGRLVIDDQKLYKPVARDFCKSYLAIISHRPHMQILGKWRWEEWMSIACSAVLDDVIKPDKFQISGKIPLFSNTHPDDPIEILKKFDSTFKPTKLYRGISIELIDFMNCINTMIHSSTAPLTSNSSTLLTFFVRFFCTYTSETDAHLIAVTALGRLLSEIELNKPEDLHRFAPFLWKLLCIQWSTKQNNMKEQIAICLRYLLPFISNKSLLKTAYRNLADEPSNNPCLEPLALEALWITPSDSNSNGPFKTSSLYAGNNFTPLHALSWVVIELAADIAFKLHSTPDISSHSSESPSKRRKSLNFITEQLNSLKPYWKTRPSTRNSSIVVYRLQIVFFVLEKYQHNNMPPSLIRELTNSFVELLAADHNIQSWSLVCLGALAKCQSQDIITSIPPESDDFLMGWLPVWNFCIARMSNITTSRAATFALCIMIEFRRVSSITLRNDLENIIQEINIQGPPMICDSSLLFFQHCLAFGEHDMKLARRNMRDQIIQWLFNFWKPLEIRNNSSSNENNAGLILNLLLALSSVPLHFPIKYFEGSLPSCPSSSAANYWYDTSEIRQYVFDARLPDKDRGYETSAGSIGSGNSISDAHQKKITLCLSRLIEQAVLYLEPEREDNNSKSSSITQNTFRSSCELAVISLLFEAHLKSNSNPLINSLAPSSSALLDKISNLTLDSRARFFDVLKSLNSILIPLQHYYLPLRDALLPPGIFSDMEFNRQFSKTHAVTDGYYNSIVDILWTQENTSDVLSHLISRASDILHSNEDSNTEQDDFVQPSTATTNSNRKSENEFKLFCIRLILTGIKSCNYKNNRWNNLISDLIIDSDASNLISLGKHFARAIDLGYLRVSAEYIRKCLTKIGLEVLNCSDYAPDENAHYLVLSLLGATIHMWIDKSCIFRDEALALFNWSVKLSDQAFPTQSRILLVELLCSYVQKTPQLEAEITESQFSSQEDESNGSEYSFFLAKMFHFVADDDIRVRYRNSSLVPRLFEISPHSRSSVTTLNSIWRLMEQTLTEKANPGSIIENCPTVSLLLGNIMITSGIARRAPYLHLIRRGIKVMDQDFIWKNPLDYTHCILEAVADRLSLKTLARLHSIYASHITRQNLLLCYRNTVLPTSICGDPDEPNIVNSIFKQTGAALISQREGEWKLFEEHCSQAQVPSDIALKLCLPGAIAIILLDAFSRLWDSENSDTKATIKAESLIDDLARRTENEEFLRSVSDQIAVEVLLRFCEENCSLDESPDIIGSFVDERTRTRFQNLVPRNPGFRLYRPPPPSAGASEVVHCLLLLHKKTNILDFPAAIYNVIQELLARAWSSPFFNDKIRSLYSMAMFISMCDEDAIQIPTLRMLLHALVHLYEHDCLAELCSSLIQWLIDRILVGDELANLSWFPLLVRKAAHTAYRYSTQKNLAHHSLHVSLLEQLENSLFSLEAKATLLAVQKSIRVARLMWPRELSFSEIYDFGEVIELFNRDRSLLKDAFQVLEVLLSRRLISHLDAAKYAWQITSSSSPNLISNSASIALANILIENGCHMRKPSLHDIANISVSEDEQPSISESQIQQKIIADLLNLQLNPDLQLVKSVSETLKILWKMPDISKLFPENTLSDHIVLDAGVFRLYESQSPGKSNLNNLSKLNWVQKLNDDDMWAVQFASLLADVLDDGTIFYSQLVPIMSANDEFCASAIGYLVHILLLRSLLAPDNSSNADIIPNSFSYAATCDLLSAYFSTGLKRSVKSQKNQLLIISVLNGLRQHPKPGSKSPSSGDEWLIVDWMLLAQACVRCKSYTDALMYVELEHGKRHMKMGKTSISLDSSSIVEDARTILYEVYANIDEPDGFYSIATINMEERLIHQYRHEERWSETFELAAARSEALNVVHRGLPSNAQSSISIVKALASTGFNHLAFSILNSSADFDSRKNTSIDIPLSRNLPYELAWRGQIWDLPPVDINERGSPESVLYSALKCIQDKERKLEDIESQINSMINLEVKKIVSSISLDRPIPETSALGCLVCLREIQLWRKNQADEHYDDHTPGIKTQLYGLPFDNLERVLLTRLTLAKVSLSSDTGVALGFSDKNDVTMQIKCLLQLSSAARNEGHLQTALNSVSLCKVLTQSAIFDFDYLKFQSEEEMARVLWLRGERLIAIDSMLRLIDETGDDEVRKALILSQLGQWMTIARSRRAVEIDESFFRPAVDIARDQNISAKERAIIFARYAEFADEQLQVIDSQSSDTERLRALRGRKQAEHDSFKQRIKAGDRWLSKYQHAMAASLEIDGQRLSEIDRQQDVFLRTALDTYSKLLECDPDSEGAVFRLVSLWFAHHSDDNLNLELSHTFHKIPTRAFVFLSHQLSARLSTKNDTAKPFVEILYSLVTRLCQDHPFHTLYQVYSLRQTEMLESNGSNNTNVSSLRRRSSTNGLSTPPTQAQVHRAKAAENIFQAMRVDERRSHIVQELERACEAFIEIALFTPSQSSSRKSYSIPDSLKLRSLRQMSIPVPTAELVIDPTCTYDKSTMPCIERFSSQYNLAGGVNLPKIMECYGSDGQRYRLLFKGGDDVRQDAVMQQVFGLVNTLLTRDRQTRKRQLHVRTYKVIPLIGLTGILEFAGNTCPMRDWLAKAHKRYHKDWASGQARSRFESVRNQSKSTRVSEFRKIREKTPPTMRYFFIEQHKIAALWLEMRTSYSRSIATSSMVGWMLGLGDRHVSNILMDKTTGEAVHVDLGVAFDAGMLLPIPETVPFRLTAEIIDGFGMSGIEGVFRKCSEQTLRVLREKKNIIMMILEVLKYDPLQKWTLTTAEALKIQGSESPENGTTMSYALEASETMEAGVPVEATRALVEVGEKLSNALSVAARVNELILEATDVERLATLFSLLDYNSGGKPGSPPAQQQPPFVIIYVFFDIGECTCEKAAAAAMNTTWITSIYAQKQRSSD